MIAICCFEVCWWVESPKKFGLLLDQVTAHVLLAQILTQEAWNWTFERFVPAGRLITGTKGADFSHHHLLEWQALSRFCDSYCNFLYPWSGKHSHCNAVMKCAEMHVGIQYDDLVKMVINSKGSSFADDYKMKPISLIYNILSST